jgi:cobalt/nickel transport protein
MTQKSQARKNKLFALGGLGVALIIAVFVSPFASSDPDGLDRAAQDLEFESKAQEETIAGKLPFAALFDEYAVKGVPEAVATPLAGLAGTLITFGLAWGLGKVSVRHRSDDSTMPSDQE